ncbi:DUF3987 domain-containing protein [Rhizobium leguminosarum]|uniref:DUF3987 domain-containing protein n=1 Tax=Rhizobium leguminosarum TaxID=384 RepID=UPI003F978C42
MSIQSNILPRPGTITNIVGIPQDLRNIPQWVLWKPLLKDGKVAKVPCFLGSDGIDHTNPANWRSFDAVVADMQSDPHGRYGIGLVLAGSGIICIDHDDHPGGDEQAIREGAETIREMLVPHPTYAETSISGKGQHVFYRGILPHGRTYGGVSQYSFEIYSDRFIAITGNTTSAWGAPTPVADGQVIIDAWKLPEIVRGAPTVEPTVALGRRLDLSDRDVFRKLEIHRPTQYAWLGSSETLHGLRGDHFSKIIGDLDKITGDPVQIDRMIRKSPMYQNGYNAEKYDREGEAWLARKGCANMFENWLLGARSSNDRHLPFGEVITPERKAFLDSVLTATFTHQKAINQERVPVPSIPEVPAVPAAPVSGGSVQHASCDTSAIDYWAPATPASVPPHVLPHVLDELVQHVGDSTGLDKAALCVLALAACSMVTSDKIRIQPVRSSDRWRERFGLWGIGVGASGAGKSPLINIVGKPLKAVDKAIRDSWARRCDDLRKQATAEGKKLTDKDLPPCPDLILGDTTTESAQDAMMCKNDGVGILDEEVTQFFAGIDRYTNSGKGDVSPNRALWLKSFDGIGDTVRRIGRGKLHIDNISVSIVGCIQPDPIKKISEAGIDDGMMQRITPVLLCDRKTGTDAPIQDVLDKYDALIYRLAELTGQHVVGGTHRDGATLFFSAEAQQVFRERQESTKLLTEHFSEIYPSLHMHLKKYDGILARLSLGLHMIEHASLPQQAYMQQNWISNIVEVVTIRKAETLLFKFMLNHAMAFHLEILGSGQDATIRSIAGYILTHKVELVTLRLLQRNIAPCRELDRRDYSKILDRLSADGWLTEVQPGPKSTSAAQGIVNPEVHVRFAKKAEDERARREEIYRLASGIKYKGRV